MSTLLPQLVFTQVYAYHREAVDQKGSVQYAPGWGTTPSWVVSGMLEKMEPGFRINRPTTTVNEVPPDPTVTFMGRKLPMVKTAFGRSLPVVPIPPERHGTGLRNRKNRHSQ